MTELQDVDVELDKGIRAGESNRAVIVQASAADECDSLAVSPVLGPVPRPPPLCMDPSDEAFADTSAHSPVLVRDEAILFGTLTPSRGKEEGIQSLQSPRCSQSTSQNSPILLNIGSKREEAKGAKNTDLDAAVELSATANSKGTPERKKDFQINVHAAKQLPCTVTPQRSRMSPIHEDISSVRKDAAYSDFAPILQATGERIVSCSRGSSEPQTKIQQKMPQRSLGKRSISIYGVHEDYSADFMKQKRQRLPLNQIGSAACDVAQSRTVAFVPDSSAATDIAAAVRGEMTPTSRVTMRRSDTMPVYLGTHSRNISRDVQGKQVNIRWEQLANSVIKVRHSNLIWYYFVIVPRKQQIGQYLKVMLWTWCGAGPRRRSSLQRSDS
jgi:hypothetical protein